MQNNAKRSILRHYTSLPVQSIKYTVHYAKIKLIGHIIQDIKRATMPKFTIYSLTYAITNTLNYNAQF